MWTFIIIHWEVFTDFPFPPSCAVLGVLAWVTVNFLTGKTLLVFCYVGVSGQEARVYTEAQQWKTLVSCLRLWAWITGPKQVAKTNSISLRLSHSDVTIRFVLNKKFWPWIGIFSFDLGKKTFSEHWYWIKQRTVQLLPHLYWAFIFIFSQVTCTPTQGRQWASWIWAEDLHKSHSCQSQRWTVKCVLAIKYWNFSSQKSSTAFNICGLSNRKQFTLRPRPTFPSSTSSTTLISSTHTGRSFAAMVLHFAWIMYQKSNVIVLSSSHSYLGNGLYAARLATLGALGADGSVHSTFHHPSGSNLCHTFFGRWQTSPCFCFTQAWIGKSSLAPASPRSSEKMWLLVEPPTKLAGFQTVR